MIDEALEKRTLARSRVSRNFLGRWPAHIKVGDGRELRTFDHHHGAANCEYRFKRFLLLDGW